MYSLFVTVFILSPPNHFLFCYTQPTRQHTAQSSYIIKYQFIVVTVLLLNDAIKKGAVAFADVHY